MTSKTPAEFPVFAIVKSTVVHKDVKIDICVEPVLKDGIPLGVIEIEALIESKVSPSIVETNSKITGEIIATDDCSDSIKTEIVVSSPTEREIEPF